MHEDFAVDNEANMTVANVLLEDVEGTKQRESFLGQNIPACLAFVE